MTSPVWVRSVFVFDEREHMHVESLFLTLVVDQLFDKKQWLTWSKRIRTWSNQLDPATWHRSWPNGGSGWQSSNVSVRMPRSWPREVRFLFTSNSMIFAVSSKDPVAQVGSSGMESFQPVDYPIVFLFQWIRRLSGLKGLPSCAWTNIWILKSMTRAITFFTHNS